MPQRIGVMGGTFDPVHLGHLRVAEEAVESLGLDRLIFIPAAQPPHKMTGGILPFEHRLRMLELSVNGHPRFRTSELEKRLSGKSFTVLTLRALRAELQPDDALFFLLGMDSFLELPTWWRYMELFRLAHLVVLRRPGFDERRLDTFVARSISPAYTREDSGSSYSHPELLSLYFLDNTRIGISSTHVRSLALAGRSLRYLVLPEVMSYINEHCLYRTCSP